MGEDGSTSDIWVTFNTIETTWKEKELDIDNIVTYTCTCLLNALLSKCKKERDCGMKFYFISSIYLSTVYTRYNIVN